MRIRMCCRSVLRVGGRGKAVALDLARFRDESERGGVAFLHNAFDGVDLFAAHHAHEHFVFLSRIVAYAVHNGDAAVHFARDVLGDFVVLVRNDVEHQR